VREQLILLDEMDNKKEEDWPLEKIPVRQCMIFISMKTTDVISIQNEEGSVVSLIYKWQNFTPVMRRMLKRRQQTRRIGLSEVGLVTGQEDARW
jgi:hypothetical protein